MLHRVKQGERHVDRMRPSSSVALWLMAGGSVSGSKRSSVALWLMAGGSVSGSKRDGKISMGLRIGFVGGRTNA